MIAAPRHRTIVSCLEIGRKAVIPEPMDPSREASLFVDELAGAGISINSGTN